MTRLGAMLRLYRAARGLGVRELAPEIGTSAATLSRIERGHAMDATTTMLRLMHWMSERDERPTR
jgi:transcriptional regulator with XRE-family HTH domain